MSKPKRIKLQRSKGWRMPPNAKKVDRSTRWGNPYKVGETDPNTGHPMTAADSVEAFEGYATDRSYWDRAWLEPLRGKDLACWCRPGDVCHADVLLSLANR